MARVRFGTRRGAASHSSARHGFTLMDLMVTIALIAIVAAVGVPVLYPSVVEYRLNAAGQEVISAVEFARARALITGAETRVSFDVAADTVLVEELKATVDLSADLAGDVVDTVVETKVFSPIEHPLDPGSDYLVSLGEDAWSGVVDLASLAFGGDTFITYDPRGVPSTGGSLRLVSDGEQLVLTVDGQSGRVSL